MVENAKKARRHAERVARLTDEDYLVLAMARMGKLRRTMRAIARVGPVFSWTYQGKIVDPSLRRLHKVGWLRLHPDEIRFND